MSVAEAGMVAWLALYFGIGFGGTWVARRYALRRRLIDQPGARRSHDTPTPRGGGIAIVCAWLVALAWACVPLPRGGAAGPYPAIAAGLVLVAGVGWLDDHRPLSPWLRLAVHGLAAVTLAGGLHAAGAGVAVSLFAFVSAMALTNIWNFMDGIDGLAASQAALVALGFAALASATDQRLALALVAACAGFLPFNLPRARIFLGDVGSGTLGFALAALASVILAGHQGERAVTLAAVLVLPLSAFVVDAALTLSSRIFNGERWWMPHTQHAYQRWTRSAGRHDVATRAYALWTAGAVLLMVVLSQQALLVIMGALGATYLAAALAWWRLQRKAQMGNKGAIE